MAAAHVGVEETSASTGAGGAGAGSVAAAVAEPVDDTPVELTFADGTRLFHPPGGELEAKFLHATLFTRKEYTQFGVYVREGDAVVDVGSNIGAFANFVHAKTNGTAKLVAVEPVPRLFNVLKANVATREWVNDPTLVMAAAGTHTGPLTFTYLPDYSLLSGIAAADPPAHEVDNMVGVVDAAREGGTSDLAAQLRAIDAKPGVSAEAAQRERHSLIRAGILAALSTARHFDTQCHTLSHILRDSPLATGPIHLLKVDVEKAELDVLQSLSDADWARVQQVAVEVHSIGDRVEVIERLLTKHGFTSIRRSEACAPKFMAYHLLGLSLGDDVSDPSAETAEGLLVNLYATRQREAANGVVAAEEEAALASE